MTGLEAIPKLTELLTTLIKGAKDRETQILVQEIQTHQFVIQTALMEANAKMLKMETDHFHAITAIRENHRLQAVDLNSKIDQLMAKLAARNAKPKDELEPQTLEILKAFFKSGRDLTGKNFAAHFRISESVVDYHIDELLKKRFIIQTRIGMATYHGESAPAFRIDAEGRAYIVKNGLAD
jgi:hypothetical protein